MAENDDAEKGNADKKNADKAEYANTLWKAGLATLAGMVTAGLLKAFEELFQSWIVTAATRVLILVVLGGIAYYGYRLIVSPRKQDLDDLVGHKRRKMLQLLGWFMLLATAPFFILILVLTLIPVGGAVIAEVAKLRDVVFPPPPKIEITAEQETVRLGESSQLTATADGNALPAGHRTHWTSEPELPPDVLNHSTGRFAPDEKYLKPGESQDVTVSVTVKDSKDREIGRTSKILKVVYAPILSLDASKSRVLVGGSVQLTAKLNGASPSNGYSFVWTASDSDRPADSTGSTFEFTRQDAPGGGKDEEEITVEVQAFDERRNEVGKAKKTITLAKRSPFYAATVFDASERMVAKDSQGMPLFEAAKKAVDEQVLNAHSFGGNFGIWAFGDQKSSASGNACSLVEQVYAIGSNKDEAKKQLGLVAPGGKDAPLILAMQTAISALADFQGVKNSHFALVTITGGDDTCRSQKVEEYLAQVKELMEASGFSGDRFKVKYRTFTIAYVLADDEAARWNAIVQSKEYLESPQHLVFVARDPGILWATTAGIAGLHSPDVGIRQQAADQLKTLFAKQGDVAAGGKISAYVDDFEQ